MRILLVEDEEGMVNIIRAALKRHDILVDHAPNLEFAREAVAQQIHDAVLLDRKLPDGDGLSLIPFLRAKRRGVPIVVLSAMGASNDRIEGLDTGADDYLGKPFSLDELVARLRAVLRRSPVVLGQVVRLGNVSFDTASRQIEIGGTLLDLPRRENLVLETLIRRSGRTVARQSLEEAVFGYDDDIASNTLDSHISRLRKRMTEAGATAEICTVRGIGYLLRMAQ